jgi:hypothetical protein
MKWTPLALTIIVPLLGCGGGGEAKPVYDKVEIKRLLPLNAKQETAVEDGETIAKLAAFFPAMGQGKKSNIAAGWKAAYRLTFWRAGGEFVTINVDSKGELWTEGQGDWQAQPELRAFLDKLLKYEEPHAGWSREVKGLRGRLVRQRQLPVGTTEIIGVAVELKNVWAEPLAIRNDPASVQLKLFDAHDQALPRAWLPRSGPIPFPQWGVLPGGSYLGFSLYDYGVGVPQGQGPLLTLLPYAGDWVLKPGKYSLRGSFSAHPRPDNKPPKNAWRGQLELPSLEIEVR